MCENFCTDRVTVKIRFKSSNKNNLINKTFFMKKCQNILDCLN